MHNIMLIGNRWLFQNTCLKTLNVFWHVFLGAPDLKGVLQEKIIILVWHSRKFWIYSPKKFHSLYQRLCEILKYWNLFNPFFSSYFCVSVATYFVFLLHTIPINICILETLVYFCLLSEKHSLCSVTLSLFYFIYIIKVNSFCDPISL